jgi:hypothetical protein
LTFISSIRGKKRIWHLQLRDGMGWNASDGARALMWDTQRNLVWSNPLNAVVYNAKANKYI